jgi:general secretion pathway protein C
MDEPFCDLRRNARYRCNHCNPLVLLGMAARPQDSRTTAFGTFAVVALVLLLAWQLAYWTWRFAAPVTNDSRAAAAERAVDLDIAARLFGGQRTPSSAALSSLPGLKLKGVVAPTPGTVAAAIFARPGARDVAVFIDGEVQSGVKLAEVHPDHVIVTRAGARERIDLETARSAVSSLPQGGRLVGFKLNVTRSGANNFSLSRKELDDALRDPNQLGYLGQIGVPPGGGVRMEAAPSGSLASKLGLQPGDIIRKVNGQAVASPGDLARLYQQFATLSQVQAEVQRGTSTLQISYAIQP